MEKNIITISGANWKHVFLNKLSHNKKIHYRKRLFHFIRKYWGLDLLKFTTPSGLKLLLDITDFVQAKIYFNNNYEAKSLALFKKLAVDSNIIFDIGAHVGQYALECAQADTLQSKDIFAIEVNPKTFTYLLNNIQLNNFLNVKPVLGAVSSGQHILDINIPSYYNMGNTQVSGHKELKGNNNYLAASISISSLLIKYNLQCIDLIKIDIEGHDFWVLSNLFEANIYPTNIIFEFLPDIFVLSTLLITLLKSKGYHITDIYSKEYCGQKEIPENNLWAQKILHA